jgi:hypothetical protein
MRRLTLVTLLILSLAVPGYAASSAGLPVTSTPPSFGGVVGTSGSNVSSTSVVIKLGSLTFVSLSCSGTTCTGTVAGMNVTLTGALTSTGGSLTSRTFPTHGAWVSAVTEWATANRSQLSSTDMTVGQIVSQAARNEGPLASGRTLPDQDGGGNHGRGGGR